MHRPRPVPTASESHFGIDELFFSTTDGKGRITSGNAVFTRTTGYAEAELVGSPHNLIRHPDMPRVVFQLLWSFLRSNRPIAAYVKNMAKDGSYYWVMASVVPVEDGFLSIRLKPSSGVLGLVEPLYRELLAVERAAEATGGEQAISRGMESAAARLSQRLGEAGFGSYEAFMRSAFTQEVTHREVALAADRARTTTVPEAVAASDLQALLQRCTAVHEFLASLLHDIEGYVHLHHTLGQKSVFILTLAEQIRLFSLNAQLASDRLGARGKTLSAVAGLMRGQFGTIQPLIEGLDRDITAAVDLLGDLGFRIAVSKLQTEMAAVFIAELDGERPAQRQRDLRTLTRCLCDSVEDLLHTQAQLTELLLRLTRHADQLTGALDAIRMLEVNGRIEAATSGIDGSVVELFDTIRQQLSVTHSELQAFSEVGPVREDADHRARVAGVRAQLGGIRDTAVLV